LCRRVHDACGIVTCHALDGIGFLSVCRGHEMFPYVLLNVTGFSSEKLWIPSLTVENDKPNETSLDPSPLRGSG
jgi:hypothetical protein